MVISKKILFRADGNASTGLGHLYRMFALVEMLKDYYEFVFITKENSNLEIIPKSYTTKVQPKEISIPEEGVWLSRYFDPKDYIVVSDGYQFNSEYQLGIKNTGFKQVYIDDLEEYLIYSDIIINHSSGAKESNYNTATNNVVFGLGTQYALLRPLFLKEALKPVSHKPNKISDVFVCFGGADKYSLSYLVTEQLLNNDTIKSIHVVVGAASNDEDLKRLHQNNHDKVYLYRNLSEESLIEVMKKTNLAIVPTSTIFYEIACLKIPTISGFFVNNQKGVYNWFNNEHCFYGVDDFTSFNFKNLNTIIDSVEQDKDSHIKNQARVIDGLQKDRMLALFNKL